MMDKNISSNTSQEILNDISMLYLIFGIQKRISNKFVQELYGYLGLYIYDIVLSELEKEGIVNKKDLPDDAFSFIHDLRKRLVHKKPMKGSNLTGIIKDDMEVDFDHYKYDCVITVEKNNKHCLYSINFGLWDLITMESEKVLLINQLSQVPEETIKTIFHTDSGSEEPFVFLEGLCGIIAAKSEKLFNPEKHCYSSGVFFTKPEPCEKDKLSILYYYTFVKLFSIIDLFLPIEIINIGDVTINIKRSVLKFKAVIIESIWNDIMKKPTELSCEIKEELDEIIDSSWYSQNRKLRDNIHYGKTNIFSSHELDFIEKNQHQYYKIVLNAFDRRINYSLGKKYKVIKWIANHTDTEIRRQKKQIKNRAKQ